MKEILLYFRGRGDAFVNKTILFNLVNFVDIFGFVRISEHDFCLCKFRDVLVGFIDLTYWGYVFSLFKIIVWFNSLHNIFFVWFLLLHGYILF